MAAETEIDAIAEILPEVFALKQLPTEWNEEWLIVPIDNPDTLQGLSGHPKTGPE